MPPLITVVIKNNIANTSIIPHISNEKYTIDLRAIFRSYSEYIANVQKGLII